MSLLSNLPTDNDIKEDGDSVGGDFSPLPSGIYALTIETAYTLKSAKGAVGVALTFKTEEGKQLRETVYITSGDDKGNKNYYINKQDGSKRFLPGYSLMDSLAELALGKPLNALDTEKKVIKVYNPDPKIRAEVPTEVDMITDLLGAEIYAGVIHQIVDKTAKDDAGRYVPTGETREQNEIDKFFRRSDKMTKAEIAAKASEATFCDIWEKKWKDQTVNKAKGKGKGSTSALDIAPPSNSSGTAAPSQSLFGQS